MLFGVYNLESKPREIVTVSQEWPTLWDEMAERSFATDTTLENFRYNSLFSWRCLLLS